jgi:hypothetical protein
LKLEKVRKIPSDNADLKITLASLVTDGAVQRVVHQQELHHAFPRFPREVRIRFYLPALKRKIILTCFQRRVQDLYFFLKRIGPLPIRKDIFPFYNVMLTTQNALKGLIFPYFASILL